MHSLCQGSGNSKWTVRVRPDGAVNAQRYSKGADYASPSANGWFPVDAVWFTSEPMPS